MSSLIAELNSKKKGVRPLVKGLSLDEQGKYASQPTITSTPGFGWGINNLTTRWFD